MNRFLPRVLALAALTVALLCGCAAEPVEVTNPTTGLTEVIYLAENDALGDADRAELDALRTAFETALSAQDASALMPYVDASFTANEETLTAFFKSIAESDGGKHALYDEYYVRGLTEGNLPVLIKKTTEEKNAIQIVPAGKEIYVALYTSGDTAPVDTMLSLVCVKKLGTWSLSWIDITDYKYHGEDAAAVHARAKAAYEAGEVMPAFLLAQMTGNIAIPGNVLRYPDTEQIQEFVYEVISEGLEDYPLPMDLAIDGVALRSVATAKTEQGVLPMFFYSTETPLEDTKAITAEAKQVYRAIGKVFPGTVEAFPTAELRMTNADPEAEENFDYETVIVSLN